MILVLDTNAWFAHSMDFQVTPENGGQPVRVRRRGRGAIVAMVNRAKLSGDLKIPDMVAIEMHRTAKKAFDSAARRAGSPAGAGPTQMRMMVFLLLKKVGSVAGRGLGGTDAHERCDSGDVDAELRRLSDAGAVRCGSSGIEATGAGREAAAALEDRLDERTAAILRNTKWFHNDMTDNEALVYTRAAYPEAGGPDERRMAGQKALEDVLIGLIGKEKFTSTHAARLLRRDRADVMRMASAAGVPVFQ